MQRYWSKTLFYIGSFLACTIMAITAGCASGGFKLTRKYASWLNSNNIIIRIILYILTSVVFAVTILIDMVIFNTIDFWEGIPVATMFDESGKVMEEKILLPNSPIYAGRFLARQ